MSPKQSSRPRNSFDKIRDFLNSYIVFPVPEYADICALWALGTHVYQKFDSFGYLVITASTKRSGKSTLLELLAMVSHDSFAGSGITASVIRDFIAQGKSVFFDESEAMTSEAASQMRSYLNIGYRYGQTIPVRVSIDEIRQFPAYGPKCFAMIGDPNDTLRDRSISIEMRRVAEPPKVYRFRTAKTEADIILGTVESDTNDSDVTREVEATFKGEIYDALDVPILRNREGEVWSVIFSLAKVFCPERFDSIIACAVNMASEKMTTEKRTFSDLRKTEEEKTANDTFRKWALTDLAAVFESGEKSIYTVEAIERMKAISTSPWRTYRGDGLTPVMLSDMLALFDVCTKDIKTYEKSHGVRKQIVRRGFKREDVIAGLKKMGEK